MKAVVDRLEADYEGKFNLVRIDVNRQTDYVARFKIEVIPTTVAFDGSGNQTSLTKGLLTTADLVELLKQAGMP